MAFDVCHFVLVQVVIRDNYSILTVILTTISIMGWFNRYIKDTWPYLSPKKHRENWAIKVTIIEVVLTDLASPDTVRPLSLLMGL